VKVGIMATMLVEIGMYSVHLRATCTVDSWDLCSCQARSPLARWRKADGMLCWQGTDNQ